MYHERKSIVQAVGWVARKGKRMIPLLNPPSAYRVDFLIPNRAVEAMPKVWGNPKGWDGRFYKSVKHGQQGTTLDPTSSTGGLLPDYDEDATEVASGWRNETALRRLSDNGILVF